MILRRGRQNRPGPKRAEPEGFLVLAPGPYSGLAPARAHHLIRACGLLHPALSRLLRWRHHGRGRGSAAADGSIHSRFLRLYLRPLRGHRRHDGLLLGWDIERALRNVLTFASGLGAAGVVAGGARGPRRRPILLRPGDAARPPRGRDGAGDSLSRLLPTRRHGPEWPVLDLRGKERDPCRTRGGLCDG